VQIRYHLDESVSHAVAIGLRQRGVEVTTATDAGLVGASDPKHLEYARSENRVAVSHDSDFLRLHAKGVSHAGIAYCHQRNRSIGQIVNSLTLLWRIKDAEDLKDVVTFL